MTSLPSKPDNEAIHDAAIDCVLLCFAGENDEDRYNKVRKRLDELCAAPAQEGGEWWRQQVRHTAWEIIFERCECSLPYETMEDLAEAIADGIPSPPLPSPPKAHECPECVALRHDLDQLQKTNISLVEEAEDAYEALHKIIHWADAYPLDIFPEPDFKNAAELLKAGGITLDAVSASCMRHVVEGVGKIAREALPRIQEEGTKT